MGNGAALGWPPRLHRGIQSGSNPEFSTTIRVETVAVLFDMQAQRQRDWYLRNREAQIEKSKASRIRLVERNKNFVQAFLAEHPCVDCGEADLVVLDFDHIGSDKIANISDLVYRPRSLAIIESEIAKCEVVCANCHRRRTAQRRG